MGTYKSSARQRRWLQSGFRPAVDVLEDRHVLATSLVSVANGGALVPSSYLGGVSADGRYVVFESYADTLTGNDFNGKRDVFLRDVQLGVTTLVSTDSTGTTSANNDAYEPFISPNGRYVVYSSQATNVVSGIVDTNANADVFVYDRVLGTNKLVSVAANGLATGGAQSVPTAITDDGDRIVFVSRADDLVSGAVTDANGDWDTFVRDQSDNKTILVSVRKGNALSGDRDSGFAKNPQISADGRYVVFESSAHDLISDPKQGSMEDGFASVDVFRRDLQTNVTTLVNVESTGNEGSFGHSRNAVITPDARYVVFESTGSDLVINDTNGIFTDVFVRDMQTNKNYLVSRSISGGSGNNGSIGFAGVFGRLSVSDDGRYVAFESTSTDLVANDTNGALRDVFVRDTLLNTTVLESAAAAGGSGNEDSFEPRLSPSGRFLVFRSEAGNLAASPTDANGQDDIYFRDLFTGSTKLISVNRTGTGSGSTYSNDALLSRNVRNVVFNSAANDLTVDDVDTGVNVFLAVNDVPTGALQFKVTDASIDEDAGVVTVTVERVNGTSGAAGVSFATTDGSAFAGIDYVATTGTLTFGDGEDTQIITIPLVDDVFVEYAETFTVTLSNPTGDASLGQKTTMTVTITNEDDPKVIVTPLGGAYTSEAGNTARFKIYLTSMPMHDVSIALTSSLANEGTPSTQLLTLNAWTAMDGEIITVTGVNDGVADGNTAYSILTGAATSDDDTYDGMEVDDVSLMNLGTFVKKTATFQDQDGDLVTVKLVGAGDFGLLLNDPDADGKGSIDSILFNGTSTTDGVMTISVVKGATGNGRVDVGSLQGTGLKSLTAKKTNLVGAGINLSGALLNAALGDVLGADVIAGGLATQPSVFTARVLGDGTTVDLGTKVTTFTAARFGAGSLSVPAIGVLTITGNANLGIVGDFLADVTVSGAGVAVGKTSIKEFIVAGAVDGADFTVIGGNVGLFQSARFLNSSLFVGFDPTGTDPFQGGTFTPGLKVNTFTVTSGTTGFVNSYVAADRVGTVTLKSATFTNGGKKFGVLAKVGITKVKVAKPVFNYITFGSKTQSSGDFMVKWF